MTSADATPPDDLPTLERNGPVATVRLRRPARRNALRDADLLALLAHFAAVEADRDVRVLVMAADTTGQRRPVFSAGYDVSGFDGADHDIRLFERVPETLQRLRPVTVCALSGSVYGGATDLVLACDLRVALAGSVWQMPAAALGLHYYPSGLERYVARLGPELARRAFLTGAPLPVEALQAAGIFAAVTEADAFDAALAAVVDGAAALAPLAAQATKQSLLEIEQGRHDLERLRAREAAALASRDFAEGRAAVREQRPPRFEGR